VRSRLAILAAAVALAACGGASATPTGPSDSPLPAGTHTSTVFQPAVTFTVPDGWTLASDSADYLQLRPAGQDVRGIHLFRGVAAASQDPSCPIEAEPGIGSGSTELVEWIRGLDGLVVSSPAMVSIGGLRGVSIDLAIAPGWSRSCPFANGVPTVPLLAEPGTGLRWVVAGGERLRLYVLDLPAGGTLISDVDDFEGSQIGDLLAAALPIVKSMEFAVE
jgi:hypothetical protein